MAKLCRCKDVININEVHQLIPQLAHYRYFVSHLLSLHKRIITKKTRFVYNLLVMQLVISQ